MSINKAAILTLHTKIFIHHTECFSRLSFLCYKIWKYKFQKLVRATCIGCLQGPYFFSWSFPRFKIDRAHGKFLCNPSYRFFMSICHRNSCVVRPSLVPMNTTLTVEKTRDICDFSIGHIANLRFNKRSAFHKFMIARVRAILSFFISALVYLKFLTAKQTSLRNFRLSKPMRPFVTAAMKSIRAKVGAKLVFFTGRLKTFIAVFTNIHHLQTIHGIG